jgi:hypothetical protein
MGMMTMRFRISLPMERNVSTMFRIGRCVPIWWHVPGAVSTYSVMEGSNGSHTFLSRSSSLGERKTGLRTEVIDPPSFLFEHVMMGLRLKRGFRSETFWGLRIRHTRGVQRLIESLEKRGLTIDNDRLYFKGEGDSSSMHSSGSSSPPSRENRFS